MSNNAKFSWSLVALILLFVGVIVALQQRSVRSSSAASRLELRQPSTPKRIVAPSQELVDSQAIKSEENAERDLSTEQVGESTESAIDYDAHRSSYLASMPSIGKTPMVKAGENKSTARLSSELLSPDLGRNIYEPLKPFDRSVFLSDPEDYLSKIRPNRVKLAAIASKDVRPLESLGGMHFRILQGDSCFLKAKVEPGMPCTFHASMGEFENRLKTISVASSEEGVAQVRYRGTSGVWGSLL